MLSDLERAEESQTLSGDLCVVGGGVGPETRARALQHGGSTDHILAGIDPGRVLPDGSVGR